MLFFKKRNYFTTTDFTLLNWKEINSILEWLVNKSYFINYALFEKWENNLSFLDIWINATPTELGGVKIHEVVLNFLV